MAIGPAGLSRTPPASAARGSVIAAADARGPAGPAAGPGTGRSGLGRGLDFFLFRALWPWTSGMSKPAGMGSRRSSAAASASQFRVDAKAAGVALLLATRAASDGWS